MPTTNEQLMKAADDLGKMLADHPAVQRYKDAQKALSDDPEAARLLAEFDRQIQTLARQEQAGMPVTDAQRQGLESLQTRIVSHLKIKAFNMAQVEFYDLRRKLVEAIYRPVQGAAGPVAPIPGMGAGQ